MPSPLPPPCVLLALPGPTVQAEAEMGLLPGSASGGAGLKTMLAVGQLWMEGLGTDGDGEPGGF